MFSLYINDLPENISKGQVCLFADDTTFYYIGQTTEEVIDALNVIGNDVHNWCQKNQLSIHSGKSEALLMTAQDFIGPLKPVMIGEDIIDYVQSSKCLGVTIDNQLNWNLHISKVLKSYKSKVSQLRRMSYLPVRVKEEIYFKTIISSVTYGMAVWGTCSPALMTEIEKTHIRAAKLIHNLSRNVSNENVLFTVSWDPLDYIYKRKILTFVHKSYHGDDRQAKSYVTKNVHRYAKRDTLSIPRASTEKGRTSFSYRGPLLWNNLKPEIRGITNLSLLKRRLKDNKEVILSVSFKKDASQITCKSVIPPHPLLHQSTMVLIPPVPKFALPPFRVALCHSKARKEKHDNEYSYAILPHLFFCS